MQIAGGLVRQNHLGIGDDRACDADQLLLPARELIREQVLLADHLEAVQSIRHDGLALAAADVAVGERNLEVLVHRQRIEQVVALEHESEVLLVNLVAVLFAQRMDRVIEEMILAGPGGIVHSDQVQQRGFSGAGGSHDGDELALGDIHIDAAQHERLGRAVLEEFFDVTKLDHNFSCKRRFTAAGSAWPRDAFIT